MATRENPPGLFYLVQRFLGTTAGAIRNRLELFAVEFQEERIRITSLLLYLASAVLLAGSGLMLVMTAILLALPPEARPYVAGGLGLLLLGAAAWVFATLKKMLHQSAFQDSIHQLRKDSEWLRSSK